MELKWLEDIVAVAETGHFARAAEQRNITQSAFSRRIKSLELWLGTELLNRSQHPVRLTQAGRDFLPVAKEMIRLSYEARGRAMEFARIADTGITVACLHTLSLFWVPSLISKLRTSIGPFETSIVAETRTVDEYLEGLFNGSSDFFICYRHHSVPLDVDEDRYPCLTVGRDVIQPYIHRDQSAIDLHASKGPPIAYIDYSGSSFMSHIVEQANKTVPFQNRLSTVYRGSLAESLCTAALQGLGLAWLPGGIVAGNPRADQLVCASDDWRIEVDIVIFKAATNSSRTVNLIWDFLERQS